MYENGVILDVSGADAAIGGKLFAMVGSNVKQCIAEISPRQQRTRPSQKHRMDCDDEKPLGPTQIRLCCEGSRAINGIHHIYDVGVLKEGIVQLV